MGIKIGNLDLSNIYVGNSQVSKVYVGNVLKWEKGGDIFLNWVMCKLEKVTEQDLDGVTNLRQCAFAHQTLLKTIDIPATVTGGITRSDHETANTSLASCFYDCPALEQINVNENNPNYASQNGILYTKDMTTLIKIPEHYNGGATLTIPNSVTTLGDDRTINSSPHMASCAENTTQINSIVLPNSVSSIKSRCFFNSSLTNINLQNTSITIIMAHVFYSCTNLFSISFPTTCTTLGGYSFGNCRNLRLVTIPTSVTSIGNGVFANCLNLTSITYLGTMDEWNNITKDTNWNANSSLTTIHCSDGDITL